MSESSPSPRRRSRSSARGAGDRKPVRAAIEQLEWSLPSYIDAPCEAVDEEILDKVHETSLRILEEIGILMLNEEARAILKSIGCDVDETTENVRFPRELVLDAIKSAPATATITPRNPERELQVGGKHFIYTAVASAPNVSDLDGGRRIGNRKDYQNLIKLNQYFNCLHCIAGYPVEPIDLHASTRHLDATYDMLTLSENELTMSWK